MVRLGPPLFSALRLNEVVVDRFARVLALGIAAAAVSAAPASSQITLPQATQAIRTYAGLWSQASTCSWLTSPDSIVLSGEIDGLIDGARAVLGDAPADSLKRLTQAPAATDPCNSAADLQKRTQVAGGRLQWLARLDILGDVLEAAPWGKGLSTIPDNRRWIKAAIEELRPRVIETPTASAAWSSFLTDTRQEMTAMAGMMCRISAALSNRPGCPAGVPGEEKVVPGVVSRSTKFERLAILTRVQGASDPSKFWKRLPAGEISANTPPTCGPGDLVANFYALDAQIRTAQGVREGLSTTRLVVFGSGEDLGSVTASGLPPASAASADPVLRTYNPFMVTDADAPARAKGMVPGAAFVRCKVP